ncbi:MAG: hypothetical protein AAGH79_04165 [Bacteroidota bacterium]
MHLRPFLPLLLSFLWLSTAHAQIIITYIEGAASWQRESVGEWQRLEVGQNLDLGGQLNVEKDSELHLLSAGVYYRLQDAGKYEVKKLLRAKSPSVATTLPTGITQQSEESFRAIRNAAAWEKYLESLEQTSDFGIGAIAPVGGLVKGPYCEFNWLAFEHPGFSSYRLKLWAFESKQVVLETRVSGNKLGLQIEDLYLDQGETYLWQVEAVLDETYDDISDLSTIRSEPTEFLYAPHTTSPNKEALRSLSLYADLPLSCRYYLLANALETDQYYNSAFYILRSWLEEEPENLLAARSYATFLARRGYVDSIEKWMEGE